MDIILKYFPNLNSTQIKKFEQLYALYEEWNTKINVVSRKDIENLYINHVLHSLGISKVVEFKEETDILDLGTGGGFPGIPLAILYPGVHFHLVDSIGKKIKVVTEVAKALKLDNVRAEQARVERLNNKYDFVVSRGVTTLKELLLWTKNLYKKQSIHELNNGLICLKGGASLIEEIAEINKSVKTWQLKDFFKEEFFEEKKVVYVKV
jgi:16S rRNA (guanine527-N7)-methyltransferase